MLRRHFLAGLAPMLTGRTTTSQQPLGALAPIMGPMIDRAAEDDQFRKAFVEFTHQRLGTLRFTEMISNMMDDAEREIGPSVMGPIIDRISSDDEFRKSFVDYARERLGAHGFSTTLYKLMLDARPDLRRRPLMLRMMWRVISGGGRLVRRC